MTWKYRLIPSNSYGCFRHETCGSEDCSKVIKFWAKTTLHGHCSGNVDNIQPRYRFAQKGHTTWRIMGVRLWHWGKTYFKFGQMWMFSSLFSSIAMVWCPMNSFHNVVRAISNSCEADLKLCADLVKQFIRNVQNCANSNISFAPW